MVGNKNASVVGGRFAIDKALYRIRNFALHLLPACRNCCKHARLKEIYLQLIVCVVGQLNVRLCEFMIEYDV